MIRLAAPLVLLLPAAFLAETSLVFEPEAGTTVDKTFTSGRIGIGSFDDTGDFDSVRLWGRTVSE